MTAPFKPGDRVVCINDCCGIVAKGELCTITTIEFDDEESAWFVEINGDDDGWCHWRADRFRLAGSGDQSEIPAQLRTTITSMRATAEAMTQSDNEQIRQQGLELRRAAATAEGWVVGIEEGAK